MLLRGLLNLTASPSSRFHLTLRWISEVVGYADIITVTVVSTNKILTHVGLATAIQLLSLNEHLSIVGALTLLHTSGFWGVISPPTMSALKDTTTMLKSELVPVADELTLPLLMKAHSTVASMETSSAFTNKSSTTNTASPILKSTSPSTRHELSRYIRHALGTYGEKGLKFLGILPYGSTSSNTEGFMRLANIPNRRDVISEDYQGGERVRFYCTTYWHN